MSQTFLKYQFVEPPHSGTPREVARASNAEVVQAA